MLPAPRYQRGCNFPALKNPPTPLVGAGRAIGALAVELCILAKHPMHIALLGGGGAYFFARAWLWLSCRATGESVLEKLLCFGVVAALILARLQGHWG